MFQMVNLEHYIRAENYIPFKCIQHISRYNYKIFEEETELVKEFICLCSENFIFVDSLDKNSILPSTMPLYS